METIKQTIEIIQDLIQIHNDRIVGYARAINELTSKDEYLTTFFAEMIDESRKMKIALAHEIELTGEDPRKGTTTSGEIYLAWKNINDIFTGHNRQSVLESCHRGEDAALQAYTKALKSKHVPAYLHEIMASQKATLKIFNDEIKTFMHQEMEQ